MIDIQESLSRKPQFIVINAEERDAICAELMVLRGRVSALQHALSVVASTESMKTIHNAALEEAASECDRRKELQIAAAEYVAACQLRDVAKAIRSLKESV